MVRSTGQNSGQPRGDDLPPAGWGWREYLTSVVDEHGTLTAVAWKLIEHGDGPEDVTSVERALRRLRERGQRDGGVWGQRLLRRFGVPRAIEDRLRWMGLYHSPFNDLPLALCQDQLRLWDQPPVSTSRARVWLELAAASVALRQRDFAAASEKLTSAAKTLATAGPDATPRAEARVEVALTRAYLESRTGSDASVAAYLAEATQALAAAQLADGDRACFLARLVDQRGFQLNRQGEYASALALYQGLPGVDVHPFASYRRDAGLAFGYLRLGQREEARQHALRACEYAGDGGFARLRVMSLIMLARIEGGPAAAATLARAQASALRLGDEELQLRVTRALKREPG